MDSIRILIDIGIIWVFISLSVAYGYWMGRNSSARHFRDTPTAPLKPHKAASSAKPKPWSEVDPYAKALEKERSKAIPTMPEE